MLVLRLKQLGDHLRPGLHVRMLEWEHACFLIAAGAVLALPRVDIPASRLEELWGVLFLLLGLVRLGSLIINGMRQRVTSWLRAISSIGSSGIFVMLAFGYVASGRIGFEAAFCVVTALFEWANYGRAMRDVGRAS